MKRNLKAKSLSLILASSVSFALAATAEEHADLMSPSDSRVADVEGALSRCPALPRLGEDGAFDPATVDSSVFLVAQSEWDAYFESGYTYWDAKVLAMFWNESVDDAKARIGRKLLWGGSNVSALDQSLADARVEALGSVEELEFFHEAGYSYDDAQALAEFWGDPTPYDAKLRMEQNLISGNAYLVEEALLETGRR